MKKVLLLALVCLPFLSSGQTTTFDYMSATGSSKYISWTTSVWGSGFGHRIIGLDPGEFTTLNFQARHNSASWTDALVITTTGKIGIGTANPSQKLDVNGTIRTREVNVTTSGWADYVFLPDYELKPLSEVERFIEEHGHLPNVPSEKEVLDNGVNLLQMNVKLLEKVEELTLYMIELQKEIEQLKANQNK